MSESSLNLLGHDTCTACHLSMGRKNVVPGYGDVDASLIMIGEAPGADEDERGRPFVGRAGQFLRGVLDGMGVNHRAIFWSNVYQCRPPKNDISLAKGSSCPKIWLSSELSRLSQGKVIVALGRTAIGFFRPEMSKYDLVRVHTHIDTRWPDRETGPLWVVGAYHPSSVLRDGVEQGRREGNIKLVSLVASLQRAVYYLNGEYLTEEGADV